MAVDKILTNLEENGMKCNPLMCDWAVEETDFLGHWMTPTYIKPMKKEIDAILQMGGLTDPNQTRSFIGVVNFYLSLFPRRMYLLATLKDLTKNAPFSWNEEKELAFKQMKAIIATECINTYPDYSKPFHIYTDAPKYQVGAAIIQEDKLVAYFSQKLSPAQMNYSTTEKNIGNHPLFERIS